MDDIKPVKNPGGRPRKNYHKGELYERFIKRIQKGEVRPGKGNARHVAKFISDLHLAASNEELTAKQTSIIWMRFLVNMGLPGIEIAEE